MTRVVVEADGGSRGNPGPAGYGAVVFDADHRTVLAERHAGTLILAEPDLVVYVKLRALDGPLPVEGGVAFR